MEYRYTQTAIAPFFIFVAALIVYFIVVGSQDSAGELNLFMGVLFTILGVTMIVFSRLTTTIADGKVTVAFCAGWPVRSIPIKDI
jgi:hypothetical protein